MRLFRKKETPEQTDIVFEKWHTSFSMFQEYRFAPESSEHHGSKFDRGSLQLELRKKNLFAWTDDPLYRYDNFLLKAELGIDSSNGYSSAGLLFRRTDDISYYYFLISNKGYYRFDLVINGTPAEVLGWTKCPDFNPEKFSLMISADGSRFGFYLNGEWIGHVSDDGLTAGGLSFAGQNYDEKKTAVFRLFGIEIESRPVTLEARRKKLLPDDVSMQARRDFAESLVRNSRFSAALIEFKKIINAGRPDPEVIYLAADCCIRLEMYSEAASLLELMPDEERGERYYLQKGGMLYLQNEFLELRDMLAGHDALLKDNAAAANLLGNAEYALGNWEQAAAAYGRAVELDDAQPLSAVNAGRALQKCGRTDKAAAMYGAAARKYFRNGDYDELAGILPFLEAVDENNPETRILKAKLLFQDSDFKGAGKIFGELIKEKKADSSVYYLDALIQARNEKPRKAGSHFKKAIELEPDYYLYPFKFAEYLFVTGGNYTPWLETAVRLAPDDPWVLNLRGQAEMAEGDCASAINSFKTALESAPDDEQITVNYSEALFLDGKSEEALQLLNGESADIFNQRGNIYARLNDSAAAAENYEAACSIAPGRADLLLNLAAACIETDAFSRAEELLVRVLDAGDSAQAYNMMGNLALLKGEYNRAEAAYRKALELEPDYIEAVCNLAELLISRERLNDADLLLGGVRAENPGGRFEKLKDSVFRMRTNSYGCGECGEQWVVPKKMGMQPALKLVGEPPDDMPAGKCSGCGAVYCIGCAKKHLNEGRLVCAECGAPLKLSEDWMRYLYHEKGY